MTLNEICNATTHPELLNALHACRQDHPLHHPKAWRNAMVIAADRPAYEINAAMIQFLWTKADEEAGN